MRPNLPRNRIPSRAVAARYSRLLVREKEGGYSAEVLEFPGCYATGETADEAMDNLDAAIAGWVESELEQGHDIPEPFGDDEVSGRLTLRLPPSLHRRALMLAAVEKISLNRFLTAAIARYVGELDWLVTARDDSTAATAGKGVAVRRASNNASKPTVRQRRPATRRAASR